MIRLFSYVFIKYEMNNELIIFWNHGVKKISIINFFLFFSLIILIIQSTLLSVIVPKSQEIARSQLRNSDVDYFEGLIKPKKFNDNVKNLTIYTDEITPQNEFVNIYIKKTTSKEKFQITFAKKGIFETRGNNKVLVLYDGQTLNSNNNKITNFNFSKSDFGLSNIDSHLVIHKKLQEQPTIGLIKCVKNIFLQENKEILNCDPNNPSNVYKEIFERFVLPFYLPLLILIASLNLLISKEKINYLRYRIFIFLFGVFAIILSETSLGYVNNIFFKNILIILIPLLLIIITYLVLIYKFKIKELNLK